METCIKESSKRENQTVKVSILGVTEKRTMGNGEKV
jgi:hypothetical protein